MEQYARRLSDPSAPTYRRFLTPEEVGQRFGPSADTVNAVTSYLKSKGFAIRLVAKSRLSIMADATVKQAETAFSTKIYNYRAATPQGPNDFFSNATPLKLPAKIAPKVGAVGGVSDFIKPEPTVLTVNQTRSLYNLAGLFNSGRHGEGISVGISNWDGYLLSNLAPFYSTYGLPVPSGGIGSNVTKVSIGGANGENVAADGEMDLDIQMVLGMAPKCNLYLYDNAGSSDLLGVLTREADDDKADIITESWEWGIHADSQSSIDYAEAAHDLHLQMTLQGITYMSASGDYGAPGRPMPYPHVDPEVLQIGGTIAKVDGAGQRTSEVAWSVSGPAPSLGGGGGWFPEAFSFSRRPEYQNVSGFPIKPAVNFRLFPDISLNAAGDGSGAYYFFQNGGLQGGAVGTSFASPAFAGQLAVTLQEIIAQGGIDPTPTGKLRLGRIQDQVYAWQGRSDVFYDVTQGNIGLLPDGTTAEATTGWDLATGWGAADINGLVNAFLENATIPVMEAASSAAIFATAKPNLVYGTSRQGSVADLPAVDGVSYSIQTVRQPGVGQVAASEIAFTLSGDASRRRAASVTIAASSPKLTTGFVYLYNVATQNYDLVKSLTGTGATNSVTFAVDLDKYVQNEQIRVLVRAMKPSRLGAIPFRLNIDQAVVVERVKRS
jgi:subtilase family serine protease